MLLNTNDITICGNFNCVNVEILPLDSNYHFISSIADRHHHDCHLMTLTACQSIHRLPETFHRQRVALIAGGIYMTMYVISITEALAVAE